MIFRLRQLLIRLGHARQPNEPLTAFLMRLGRIYRYITYSGRSRITREDIKAVTKLLKSGAIAYGPQVRSFQDEFARLYGVQHAVCSSSGTAAVHVALAMINLNPGDEVIVPPITDMGTVLPILWQNAIPIFADIDPETWNIDPDAVQAQVTPRTRAIIAVHLLGNPCDLDRLRRIADDHDLGLIEDCAQAHWAAYKNQPIGTVGDIGTFSLQWTKHITCCEGGVTITNHPDFGERGRLFVDKGWNRGAAAGARKYPIFGINYRMSEMQAALGGSQLRRVKEIVSRRNRNTGLLIEMLSDTPGIRFQKVHPGCRHAYWCIGVTVDPDAPFTADALAESLRSSKIGCSAHLIGRPLHLCHDPLLSRRIYGSSDFPFSLSERATELEYSDVGMPVAENVLNRLAILSMPNEHFDLKLVRQLATEIRTSLDRLSNPRKMQSKQSAKYRLGVVGCGNISKQHLAAIARIPELKVTAIADISESALKSVGSGYGIESRYDDYRKMFDSEGLDIVLISLWPKLHAEVANAAAAQGIRAVLCEKPIASNLAEARAMVETARDAGTLLVIGHQHRFNPHLVLARRLIQRGEIGTVRQASCHCSSSLINNGSHLIDGLLYLLSDPKVVSVEGRIRCTKGLTDRDQPVEESSDGVIRLENGIESRIEMGEGAEPEVGWYFEGDRGRMDVRIEALRVTGKGHRKAKTIRRAGIFSMRAQMEEIVACIQDPACTHRGEAKKGYAAMEVLVGLLESARIEQAVQMPVTQMAYPLDLMEITTVASA